MKRLFSLIIIAYLFNSASFAQKTLSEGTIKMEITEVNAEDPQQAMMLESMKGSETEITFKGEQNAVNMNMMGGMMVMKINTDKANNKFDMLMDMMGNKVWIESLLSETATPEQKEIADKSKVSYDKAKTKEIAGYKCYAFTVKSPEDVTVVSGYVTEEIKSSANIIQGYQTLKFDGFPLEFTSGANGFSMTMSTISVSDKLDSTKFALDTKGYKKMSMEEFQKSMGGMGSF